MDAAFARLRKARKRNGDWGGLKKIQSFYESMGNTLMEMDMRGEIGDAPVGGKGTVRTANRWYTGRPRKRKK